MTELLNEYSLLPILLVAYIDSVYFQETVSFGQVKSFQYEM